MEDPAAAGLDVRAELLQYYKSVGAVGGSKWSGEGGGRRKTD